MTLKTQVRRTLKRFQEEMNLTEDARSERRRDALGVSPDDPGTERVLAEAIAWLGRAQDHSTTADGGVARHYSLLSGWGPSYPETTGYIVPTMLAWAEARGDEEALDRARRMLDWLTSIQLPDGGFELSLRCLTFVSCSLNLREHRKPSKCRCVRRALT